MYRVSVTHVIWKLKKLSFPENFPPADVFMPMHIIQCPAGLRGWIPSKLYLPWLLWGNILTAKERLGYYTCILRDTWLQWLFLRKGWETLTQEWFKETALLLCPNVGWHASDTAVRASREHYFEMTEPYRVQKKKKKSRKSGSFPTYDFGH